MHETGDLLEFLEQKVGTFHCASLHKHRSHRLSHRQGSRIRFFIATT